MVTVGTYRIGILTFLHLSSVTLILGQANSCFECEEYLGAYCECDRYDEYWNADKRLYGLRECKGLTQIPDFRSLCQTGDLWNVKLNSLSLSVIPDDAFLGLYFQNTAQSPNFQPTIDLSETGFTRVADGAFEAVYDDLEKLVLNGNDLKQIPEEVFKLKALTHLYLSGNKLDDLPDDAEGKLTALRVLDLSDNNLIHIPASMCDFPDLDEVDLQYNPIAGDLSDYISILSKCANLRSLKWPKTTMHCTCDSMQQYSAEYSPQFSIPATFRLKRGTSYRDMPLLCDRESSTTFVGRPVSDITVAEVWRTCANQTCSCCKNNQDKEPKVRALSNTSSRMSCTGCVTVYLFSFIFIVMGIARPFYRV